MNLKHIVSATLVLLSANTSLAAETFDESELPALKNYAFAACMYHIQAKIEPTPSITLNGLREEMDVFYQYSVLPTNFFETVYAQVELGTQNIPPSGSIRYCISWLQEDKVEGVVASLAK
ncbi:MULTISPECIES: hypothetical protein [unclassified Agarivorans]|uniref:hypothetical protein n=1 Tax=unclassified Agarivorans TaxID=2636026 RepID=UPI0026E206BA|nr:MULTISPECIES: hypothetical protein [unclassified Agarivorans]MDO6684088.1 hypothetical protein [Agarivorans sp. 3_MG-2023]MDO6714178.1 hypothetical protein [Agarivorans sp. 2_MG-2023]MDO6762577.1 hypothetical protein [Agarivorans sp. 1_MG-2023]